MKLLQEVKRLAGSRLSARTLTTLTAALAALLIPASASAAEANVVLNFTPQDMTWLYISLGLGALAVIIAFYLRGQVLKMSPGPESMRAVGAAIEEGAKAYLKKQVATMGVFVVLLAIGLFFLFSNQYGNPALGGWIALSFVLGVTASYVAGYTGMLLAVRGNMRTANAALTSYKSSLEVAFRSGAVAGLITVGMGLLGATLIFIFAKGDAMKLLVGFGFGGSLAALFMRVGGGIFTKAADVGADLVGKVEAGIPEDDPRNPATIADNVGDNVGDCAGMAADVFESYEVTLVAAIVLGAATASIFDQPTWMRLILFALMARGAGIIASIIGIFSVKGSDDIDADPLKAIRKGFYWSAGIAALLTLGLAYFMMGGDGKHPIQTARIEPISNLQRDVVSKLMSARDELAKSQKKSSGEIKAEDVQKTQTAKDLGLEDAMFKDQVSQLLTADLETAYPKSDVSDYAIVSAASKSPVLDYAVQNNGSDAATKPYITLSEALKGAGFAHLQVTNQVPTDPAKPDSPKRDVTIDGWVFQPNMTQYESMLKTQPEGPTKPKILEKKDPVIYANEAGKVILGVPAQVKNPLLVGGQLAYFKASPDEVNKMIEKSRTDPSAFNLQQQQAQIGVVQQTTVSWLMFFLAIAFGLFMAFAIELLTDYYVSTHKRPVQEVAGVSSAGPAPMIIQGFAYALESSVFMVFAIVFALLVPLYLFSPAVYGSYILSFYGIALVGLGLLTTTGYVLAMDTFGPISDNAQGVFEMSGAGHGNEMGSKAVQRLDAAGNTTKALTKGFAIATAVVAAVALFHSYLADARLGSIGLRLDYPEIFLGLMIGGAAPYLFSAFSINAVGRASFELINEVRRQFRADAGIMAGTSKPDYARCVAIVTSAAQKELLGPGILAISLPIAVAFGFSIGKPATSIGGEMYNLTGAQALGGFLAGAILSGQLMAVLLANSGGMWDNAKKLIEDGLYGGKGTEAHKAGVVCDTVGDPFKDTAGPALNPLIKVMNLVALLLAPVVIRPFDNTVLSVITVVAIAALAFSIWFSKKGSLSSTLQAAQSEGHAAAEHQLKGPDPHPPVPLRRITVEEPAESETDEDSKS